MKTLYKIALFLGTALTLSGCATSRNIAHNPSAATAGPHVSVNLFYQSLSPYGKWMNYGSYGNVWIPRVSRNFQPYATNGHWVYSDYGWTWVSGYRWGWAPFHYGRWTFDNYYGWMWIPGKVWAPAWVAWRRSSNYYGWAPLGPGMNINININIPARRWVFVPSRYIAYRNINRYYRPWNQNTTIIHNTTIINNVYEQANNHYFSGPTRRAVQQHTGRTIQPVRVFNSSKPSHARLSGNNLRIYRPTVSTTAGSRATENHRARPVRVVSEEGRATDRSSARSAGEQQTTRSGSEANQPSRSANKASSNRSNSEVRQSTRSVNSTQTDHSRTVEPKAERSVRPNPSSENDKRARPVQRPTTPPANRRVEQKPQQRSSTPARSRKSRPQRRQVQSRTSQPQAQSSRVSRSKSSQSRPSRATTKASSNTRRSSSPRGR